MEKQLKDKLHMDLMELYGHYLNTEYMNNRVPINALKLTLKQLLEKYRNFESYAKEGNYSFLDKDSSYERYENILNYCKSFDSSMTVQECFDTLEQ